METKILMSLLMIGLVTAVVGGGTWAYFSDVETSTGNTFTAGTINIAVDGQDHWTKNYQVTLGGDTLLKPSEVGWINFTISNVGNNPLEVWKHIKDPVGTGGEHPESELGEDPSDTINDIDGVIHYDLTATVGATKTQEIFETEGFTIGPGITTQHPSTRYVASNYIYLGQIPVGGSMDVKQSYHMDKDTTNWAQGDILTFTIELTAQQLGAPAPTPELSDHGRV